MPCHHGYTLDMFCLPLVIQKQTHMFGLMGMHHLMLWDRHEHVPHMSLYMSPRETGAVCAWATPWWQTRASYGFYSGGHIHTCAEWMQLFSLHDPLPHTRSMWLKPVIHMSHIPVIQQCAQHLGSLTRNPKVPGTQFAFSKYYSLIASYNRGDVREKNKKTI